jgi:GAF domain-containing protein
VSEHETALATYLGISARSQEAVVLGMLIDFGVHVVGGDEGSLLVYDEDREDLVWAMTTASDEQAEALLGQRVPLGTGITGLAAATHEVQIGTPGYRLPGSPQGGGGAVPVQNVLAAPMLVDERLIGVITAVSFDPEKHFGPHDARLYAYAASIAAVVVKQHGTITGFEALADGGLSALGDVRGDEAMKDVVASVSRLAMVTDLNAVASLLTAVERIAGAEPAP